jgi:L-fuculose-phosphate aldolase
MKETIKKDYELILDTLFQKGLFHTYQTSFSVRTENDRFIINKRDIIFTEKDIFTEVHYKEDLSWKEASHDIHIHSHIYQRISTAKCIAHIFPINLVTYSLYHHKFKPLDFYGKKVIGAKEIYEIENINNINEEIEKIIYPKMFNENVFIIQGYGAYLFDRDLKELAKKASILENSATILLKVKNV